MLPETTLKCYLLFSAGQIFKFLAKYLKDKICHWIDNFSHIHSIMFHEAKEK